MWDAIGKIFFSQHRDLFTVKLGSNLLLLQLGLVPLSLPGKIVGFILRGVLGFAADSGVYLIDLGIDSLREGMKLEDFEKEAKAAYEHTTAKVYDEAEKQAIRKKYLETIRKITFVGEPK